MSDDIAKNQRDRLLFDVDYVPPATAVETRVAAIWADLLAVDRIGLEDDVFELGCDSLLATRGAVRINEAFGVSLVVGDIFEARTIAALVPRLGITKHVESMLPRVSRDAPLRASYAQERLWFLAQLDPQGSTYNVSFALRMQGRLDEPALERALNELVQRHETLRTTLREIDGELRQLVHPRAVVTLERVDGEGASREILARAAQRPFDLANGPLLHAVLARASDDEHTLLVAVHHVATDGWSMGTVRRELAALYEAFAAGRASPLEELAIGYADFASWQRSWLEGGVLDAQLAYWRTALAAAPTALELPTDRPRPLLKEYRGATVELELPAAVTTQVHEVAKAHGATSFMVLLAAFGALLARWSRQDDVVIGTPISNRMRSEVEPLVGMFVNTLALRVVSSGAPTFAELVARVKETALSAYAHQDVPFERLVEVLAPPRDTSRTPVFQAMFTLVNATPSELRMGELRVQDEPLGLEASKVDLMLTMVEGDGRLTAALEYDVALFDRSTAERMTDHFARLLASALEHPSAPLASLTSMGEEEHRRLLVEWNATARPYDVHATIHGLFAEQVARTPGATAVVFAGESGDQELSYRDFDEHANRLAHALVARGVRAGDLVPLVCHRSLEMIIAVYGVLKAGAAYVPLSPTDPTARVAEVLREVGSPVVLTTADLAERVGAAGTAVLVLERDGLSTWPSHALDVRLTPDSAAYAIYTSGSTGRPKGTINTHRALLNRLLWMQRTYELDASDRVLQKTPYTFDVSVWELLWPLFVGATLVVAKPEGHRDPAYLAELIRRTGITTLHFVPSMLQMFLLEPTVRACTSLRRVVCSGEALPASAQTRFFELLKCELHNLYGPTEAAIDVSWWACRPGDARSSVPIGSPIDNTSLYVVDPSFNLSPQGVAGELCIGGVQLARGYLARPALTAEKFVPDPFSPVPGSRMYLTGDLARWLPDGTLEYLGRLDHQVKLRGFRIELGEIEAVLTSSGLVEAATVLLRGAEDDKRLVAYVVGKDGRAVDPKALKAVLNERVPDYMVPSAFVVLDTMPVTPNGKVDRKALPEPSFAAAASEYVAPRTATEQTLAAAFVALLRVDRVGIHDDFFALGGHSLLATRLVSQIHERLDVCTPVRIIFEAPTVAQLAERVERLKAGPAGPRLERVADRRRAPLSYNQRLWWERQEARARCPGCSNVHACRLRGPLDLATFRRSVDHEVSRHDALRTTFELVGGEPMQLVGEAREGILDCVDMLGASNAEVEAVLTEERLRAPDLAQSTCRLRLLRIADDDHVLVIAAHRIAIDPSQCDELIADVLAIYDAAQADRPSPLNQPPLSYIDYVAWQRKAMSTRETRERVASARRRLEGAVAVALPYDRPRPEIITTDVHRVATPLSESAWAAIDRLGHAETSTSFVVLSAALKAMLSLSTGQREITVVAPNGLMRGLDPSLASVFGCFADYFVLRTDLSGDPTLREIVRREHALVLDAQRNVDVPSTLVTDDYVDGPLWRVVLNSIAMPEGTASESKHGLGVEGIPVKRHRMVDLAWAVFGRDAALYGSCDKFDASTVERLAAQLSAIVTKMVTAPDVPVAALWTTASAG